MRRIRPEKHWNKPAGTPEEHAERMARAEQILRDPMGYWRENSAEPRSLTGGTLLHEPRGRTRRRGVVKYG